MLRCLFFVVLCMFTMAILSSVISIVSDLSSIIQGYDTNPAGTISTSNETEVYGAGLKNAAGEYNCFLNVIIQVSIDL